MPAVVEAVSMCASSWIMITMVHWVDEGMAELGVYNHSFSDDLCYYAQIQLSPNKVSCCKSKAVLPNVRAITFLEYASNSG
jgi:hypothetical protein